jgi:hypothetical protein
MAGLSPRNEEVVDSSAQSEHHLGVLPNTDALAQAASAVAREHHVRLAHDTHYDARNWELSWWRGRTLHRVDIQPMHDRDTKVTYYQDRFPILPRLLRWAHREIPMFPYLAAITWRSLGDLRRGLTSDEYKAQLQTRLQELL